MIVVERDFLARWIRELKQRYNSANTDYMTGYISGLSAVEGMLAVMPEYDLDKLFSPGDVYKAMVQNGQHDTRFKLGETIRYSPSEVHDILREGRRGEI